MSKRFIAALVLLVIAIGSAGPGFAQGTTPQAVYDALDDLSRRAGRTLTLNNLASWEWTQNSYPDTSLGCPQAGQTYTQVVTSGYRIVFIYNGATFDYRAPVSGGAVFLCSGPAAVPQATPRPAATPAPTTASDAASGGGGAADAGRSVCPDAMNTRLNTGDQARVRVDGLPVNIRREPNTSSAIVAKMQPGDTFSITGGPQCGEGLVWWQVLYGTVATGWAAEGRSGLYWVEPTGVRTTTATPAAVSPTTPTVPGAPAEPDEPQVYTALSAAQQPIMAANVEQLARYAEIPVPEEVTDIAWAPDQTMLAAAGLNGIWIYALDALQIPPRFFQLPNGPVRAVVFSSDTILMATAHNDTTVRLWDMETGGQRAVLRGHTQPVLAVAFSPDGARLATAGQDGMVLLWDTASQAQAGALQGHTGPVTSLAFSPDGVLLASGSEDNTVRLWDVASATPGTVLSNSTGPVRAVAFSPDGTRLASAGDDNMVRLWDMTSGEQGVLEGHTGPVINLAFNLDGTVLVSAGGGPAGTGDSSLRFWDAATDTPLTTLDSYGASAGAQITGVTFNPTGTILAFSTFRAETSVIRLWAVQP